jgi:hypothetical protein
MHVCCVLTAVADMVREGSQEACNTSCLFLLGTLKNPTAHNFSPSISLILVFSWASNGRELMMKMKDFV